MLVPIVTDMAESAAAENNVATVEGYIEAMRDHVSTGRGDYARLCYVGVEIGSSHSFDRLQEVIQEEKAEYAAAASQYEDGRRITPPDPMSSSLQAAISASAEHGLPTGAWIEQAAISGEHRWLIEKTELAQGVARGNIDQATLDAKIAELATAETTKSDFLLQVTVDALTKAKDPAVRDKVLTRLEDMLDQGVVMLTEGTYTHLTSIAAYVGSDPELSTARHITYFEEIIPAVSGQVLESDIIDAPTIAIMQAKWNVILQRFEDPTLSPRDIVGLVDSQAARIIAAIPPDVAPLERGALDADFWRDKAFQTRDYMLGDFARDAAARGKFSDAQIYVSSVTNEDRRRNYLQDCLLLARTSDQVAAMREAVDELLSALDPALQTDFEHAGLLASGDYDAITARASEYAQSIAVNGVLMDVEDTEPRRKFIRRAYQNLVAEDLQKQSDQADGVTELRASAYARVVLDGFRSAGVPYAIMRDYSEGLIAAGDLEEPQRAYDHISGSALYAPESRLLALWRLSRVITGKKVED
jgi:hypothetical protein